MNIKSVKVVLVTFLMVFVVSMFGCSDSYEDEGIKIFVNGAGQPVLFEIVEENVLEVAFFTWGGPQERQEQHSLFDDFASHPNFFPLRDGFRSRRQHSIIQRSQQFELTEEQASRIWYLIETMVANGSDGGFDLDFPGAAQNLDYALAIINGEAYWTWNWNRDGFFNETLDLLVIELLELSYPPLRLGSLVDIWQSLPKLLR